MKTLVCAVLVLMAGCRKAPMRNATPTVPTTQAVVAPTTDPVLDEINRLHKVIVIQRTSIDWANRVVNYMDDCTRVTDEEWKDKNCEARNQRLQHDAHINSEVIKKELGR